MQEERLERLETLLGKHQYRAVRDYLCMLHEADIAACVDELPKESEALVFRLLPKDLAVKTFAYLSSDAQEHLLTLFSDQEITQMVENLYTDDAVDMIEEMPANVVTRVLNLATPETRATINHFLKYPEDSAGSLMTSEYTRLKASMSVAEAISYIRHFGRDRETFYTCYITTESFELRGEITVRSLLLAPDGAIVGNLMETSLVKTTTTEDKEDIVRMFSNYDLLAMPVVDAENRLVGIITIDDVLDVAHEEATEDFEIMGAMHPSEKPYLQTGVMTHSKNRLAWLMVLMISGMINGVILNNYEKAFIALPILVSFIPMLTDSGGNAGAQSSTLIIRGMALGEVALSDCWRVIWKELRIALVCGGALAIVNFIRIYFLMGHNLLLSLTVSCTLVFVVLMAKTIGGILPLLAKKVHLDPAIMAAPLITTLVDAGALVIYFSAAELILGL